MTLDDGAGEEKVAELRSIVEIGWTCKPISELAKREERISTSIRIGHHLSSRSRTEGKLKQ